MAKELYNLNQTTQQTEVPTSEIDAELRSLLAGDAEYQDLARDVAELMTRKEAFDQQLTTLTKTIADLSTQINGDYLAIDGLSRDISQGDAVLDARAMMYLDGMDRRAKERLLKYHYVMVKAYEYRMLEPYTDVLNLQPLFDKFRALVQAGYGQNLSAGDFDALKALFEEQLSTVAGHIFDLYNANRPTLSAPMRFSLSQDQLA